MNNSGKILADDPTNCMIDKPGLKQSHYKMSIYYKYVPDDTKLGILSYVNDWVYCYTSKELVKQFVDTLGKIFHVDFLVYENCFMSIRISQLKDHYISVDQARYATSVVADYIETATMKEIQIFIRQPYLMI